MTIFLLIVAIGRIYVEVYIEETDSDGVGNSYGGYVSCYSFS